MAKSMDDCFLSSHRIDMPIQHRRSTGPGLAMHVLLDLIVAPGQLRSWVRGCPCRHR